MDAGGLSNHRKGESYKVTDRTWNPGTGLDPRPALSVMPHHPTGHGCSQGDRPEDGSGSWGQ